MNKTALLLALMLFLVFGSTVYAFGGCEENCGKCHALQKDEAQQILTKMKVQDGKVTDIRMSPIRGLWEVAFEDKENLGIMYVGFSKKYIVAGAIYEVDTAANKTQESLSEIKEPPDRYIDVRKIPLEGTLLMGDRDARDRVIVFTDPDCPFCGKQHVELKKLLAEKKGVAFYLKLMPLSFHPDAYWKSKSILCSGSLALLEDNFEKKEIPKPECDSPAVDQNIRIGAELGITGTPTIVMPDGLVLPGARDAKVLSELIDRHHAKEESK